MTRDHIANEIRRTAKENGGKPLGPRRLSLECGIKKSDWQKFWPRLGDAHNELGLGRNELSKAYSPDVLLVKYVELAKELGALPSDNDLRFKRKNDESFPSSTAFARLGSKNELVQKLASYCAKHEIYNDVMKLCADYRPSQRKPLIDDASGDRPEGYVYLLKHGSRCEYKLGKTNNILRREGEIRFELPERAEPIHSILTDDPSGIEAYWKNRWRDKNIRNEWFELTREDVAAFRRRRFM